MENTVEITKEEYAKFKEFMELQKSEEYESLSGLEGKNVFIRTATSFHTGRLDKVAGAFLKLSSAAWIANTGRLSDFMAGNPDGNMEVEPMGDTLVSIGSIVDISLLKMELPTKQQ